MIIKEAIQNEVRRQRIDEKRGFKKMTKKEKQEAHERHVKDKGKHDSIESIRKKLQNPLINQRALAQKMKSFSGMTKNGRQSLLNKYVNGKRDFPSNIAHEAEKLIDHQI